MPDRKDFTKKQNPQTPLIHNSTTGKQDSVLRQLMYERIEQGNALADVEEEAKLRWIGHGNSYFNFT